MGTKQQGNSHTMRLMYHSPDKGLNILSQKIAENLVRTPQSGIAELEFVAEHRVLSDVCK